MISFAMYLNPVQLAKISFFNASFGDAENRIKELKEDFGV